MRALQPACAALLVAVLSGCANLAVQVDVLAPEQVDQVIEQAELRRQYTAALSESEASLINEVRDRLQPIFQVLEERAEQYRAEAAAISDPVAKQDLELLARDFEETTVEDYLRTDLISRHLAQMPALDQQIRTAADDAPAKGEPITGELARLLRQRLATQRQFWAEVEKNVREETRSLTADLPPDDRESVREEIDRSLRNLPGGPTLGDSPYAYAVAKAPESVWATRYNHAFGGGIFGNVDVAIKMQALADFTVKGLTFDPRKVAEVASKVTVQSVLLGAQIAGVPVGLTGLPVGGGAPATSGLAEPSGRMAELAGKVEGRAARLRDRDQALRDIASAVLAEKDNLDAGGDAPLRARNALAAIYQANASRLDLSSVQ